MTSYAYRVICHIQPDKVRRYRTKRCYRKQFLRLVSDSEHFLKYTKHYSLIIELVLFEVGLECIANEVENQMSGKEFKYSPILPFFGICLFISATDSDKFLKPELYHALLTHAYPLT